MKNLSKHPNREGTRKEDKEKSSPGAIKLKALSTNLSPPVGSSLPCYRCKISMPLKEPMVETGTKKIIKQIYLYTRRRGMDSDSRN